MPIAIQTAPTPDFVEKTLQIFPRGQQDNLRFLLTGYEDASEQKRLAMIETLDARRLAQRVALLNGFDFPGAASDDPVVAVCEAYHLLLDAGNRMEQVDSDWLRDTGLMEAEMARLVPRSIEGAAALLGVVSREIDHTQPSSDFLAMTTNVAVYLKQAVTRLRDAD